MNAYAPPQQPASSRPGLVTAAYAGFWRRFLAVILDSIIVSIPANIFAAALGLNVVTSGGFRVDRSSGLETIFFIVYEALLIAFWHGQTIGKKVMGIRVVSGGGAPVSVGMAFARSAMKLISGAVLLLGYLWMLWDPNKQTWHDKVAQTYVLKEGAAPVAARRIAGAMEKEMRNAANVLNWLGGVAAVVIGGAYIVFPATVAGEVPAPLRVVLGMVGIVFGLLGALAGIVYRTPARGAVAQAVTAFAGIVVLGPYWLPAALLFAASALLRLHPAPQAEEPDAARWRKMVGLAILFIPMALLAWGAGSEMVGGDVTGAQHLIEIVPLGFVALLCWKRPRLGGLLLVGIDSAIIIVYAVFVHYQRAMFPFGFVFLFALVLFGPALAAGLLFLRAGHVAPHRPRHAPVG